MKTTTQKTSKEQELIKKLRKQLKTANYELTHDALTGIGNRRLLDENVSKVVKNSEKNHDFCVLMTIDVDKFKSINDTYGHLVGDEILKTVANRLAESTRKNDLVARRGGDEFEVILTHIHNYNEISNIAENIKKRFQDSVKINDLELKVTISFGASVHHNGENYQEWFKNADEMLYIVKEHGRNDYKIMQ